MRWLVVVLAVFALGIAACTLLGEDVPANTCKVDDDCFTDLERCNTDAGVCVAADGGP